MTIKIRKSKIENFRRNERMAEFLGVLASAVFLGTIIAIPILPFALKPFLKDEDNNFSPREIKRLATSLKRKRYISVEENGNIQITKKGDLFLRIRNLGRIIISIPKIWDKRYRLIIFDIPNKKKVARDIFRSFLKGVGFYMLQESVFIFPYPCEKEIREAAEILDIWDDVNVLKVERVDKEEFLLEHFHLK